MVVALKKHEKTELYECPRLTLQRQQMYLKLDVNCKHLRSGYFFGRDDADKEQVADTV